MSTSTRTDGDVVEVAIEGRLDAGAMDALAAAVRERVATGRSFGVVLDRRLLGAPTSAGRDALVRWGAEDLPSVIGPCAAWADVFDERRAASLARAARERGADHEGPGYPHRTFTDTAAARTWVAQMLATRAGRPWAGPKRGTPPGHA